MKILSFETRLSILKILSQEPKTNKEILKLLPKIKRRESIFKSLKKLESINLVKHDFLEEKRSNVYFVNFEKITISNNGTIEIEFKK